MLQRRIMVWIGLFSAGYFVGVDRLPKGEEFMIFTCLSMIAGFSAGVWMTKFTNRIKQKQRTKVKGLRLFGYELRVTKAGSEKQLAPVVKLVKPDLQPVPTTEPIKTTPLCDFCQGEEEIRLAGQKIKCPKCKGKAAAAN